MIVTVISILLFGTTSALVINEIMYNPDEDDDYNEWIELYNDDNEDIDLENYTLCGILLQEGYIDREEDVHDEDGFILEEDEYAIITDGGSGTEVFDNFDVDNNALILHVDASSLCGGLSNSGETILIEDADEETVDEVTYDDDADEGHSLELIDGDFVESEDSQGTPGDENSDGSEEEEESEDEEEDESEEEQDEETDDEDEPEEETTIPAQNNQEEPQQQEIQQLATQPTKIVLGSSQASEETPEEIEQPNNILISKQEQLRRGVLYSFFIFMAVLVILLAWQRL